MGRKTAANKPRKPKLVYIKIYPGDYASGTLHLSCLEHGAYLLLLLHYYAKKGAPLPLEMSELAEIARLDHENFTNIFTKLSKFFRKTKSGFVHDRADIEIAKVLGVSNTNSVGAKKGWITRKQNASKTQSERIHKSKVISHKSKDTSVDVSPPTPQGGSGQHVGIDGDEWRLLESRLRKVVPGGEVEAMLAKARSARGPLAYLGGIVRKAEEQHAARSAGGKTLDADGHCTRCGFPAKDCDCPPVSARTA